MAAWLISKTMTRIKIFLMVKLFLVWLFLFLLFPGQPIDEFAKRFVLRPDLLLQQLHLLAE